MMRVSALSVVFVMACVACGGAGAKSPYAHLEKRAAIGGHTSVEFLVEAEPAIAGFAPAPAPTWDVYAPLRSSVPASVHGSGVATYHLVVNNLEIGTVAHVDDTAPFFVAEGADAEVGILIPHVGAKGERLSRSYRYDWKTKTFAPTSESMPRIERFSWASNEQFIWVAPTTEPELYLPAKGLAKGWVVDKPPAGVVGGKMLRLGPANQFGGWLVRWRDGYSYSADRTALARADETSPRWTKIDLRNGDRLTGTRADGSCDALRVGQFLTADLTPSTAPSCDEALASLERVLDERQKRSAAEAATDRLAREAKEREAAKAQAELDARRTAVTAQQQREKEEEAKKAAELAKKEAPIIAEYLKLVSKSDYAGACAVANNKLTKNTHARVVIERWEKNVNLHGDEIACVRAWGPYHTQYVYLTEQRQLIANSKGGNQGSRPTGGFQNAAPGAIDTGGQKRIDDSFNHTYGSGKGSTCPYTDRSLCK